MGCHSTKYSVFRVVSFFVVMSLFCGDGHKGVFMDEIKENQDIYGLFEF